MEMDRGYYWVKHKGKHWKVGMVEWDGDKKKLSILNGPEILLEDLDSNDIEFRQLLSPDNMHNFKKYRDSPAAQNRIPFGDSRPLFFCLNPENHQRQLRYLVYDRIQDTIQDITKVSMKNKSKSFLIFEANPIGKVVDGKQIQI